MDIFDYVLRQWIIVTPVATWNVYHRNANFRTIKICDSWK